PGKLPPGYLPRATLSRKGRRKRTKSFFGDAEFGSLCAYVEARLTSVSLADGMPDWDANVLAASSTRCPPRAAAKAYMRRPLGRSWPWVVRTPSTFCASFLLPSATAPASIVSRRGWYQAVPSSPFRPHPENMSA